MMGEVPSRFGASGRLSMPQGTPLLERSRSSTGTYGILPPTRSSRAKRSALHNMPERATTPISNALYVPDGEAFEKIYGAEEQAALIA